MSDMVMFEHEMSRTPSRSSLVTLTNNVAHVDASDLKDQQRSNKTHDRFGLIRHFRLQIFACAVALLKEPRWNANTEYRKVAMHHNKAVAATHCLLHLVPLAGAITLLMFQWTSYWVSYRDDFSSALQFAAKIHELAMQASLVEVLLCLIRTQLVDGLVPLGALACILQATQLSYLWSLDFFSVFRSQALKSWRRIAYIIALPIIIGLVSVVGPSSAVLMIPRPGSPSNVRKATLYASASADVLYPPNINLAERRELNLPVLADKLMSKEMWAFGFLDSLEHHANIYRDTGLNRVLRYSTAKYSHGLSESNATIPTEAAQDAINSWAAAESGPWGNGTVEVEMLHPVVSIKCLEPEEMVQRERLHYRKDDGIRTGELPELSAILKKVSDVKVTWLNTTKGSAMVLPGPVYIQSPEPGSRSSIALLFQEYRMKVNTTNSNLTETLSGTLTQLLPRRLERKGYPGVKVCTISSYWNTGLISAGLRNELLETDIPSTLVQSKPRGMTLDFSGADTLRSAAFMRFLLNTPEQPAMQDEFNPSDGPDQTRLAIVLALLLSQKPPIDVDFFESRTPKSSEYTSFNFSSTEYGYGYGTRSTSIYLAIAVISTYCAITISYILYCIITGSVSTAWNSGIELFTLALQSRKPDHLGYTSVGMNSIKTFSEGVGIRVNQDNELEIVFANDRDFGTRDLRKVDRNKAY